MDKIEALYAFQIVVLLIGIGVSAYALWRTYK
jgi:hypothetical protein